MRDGIALPIVCAANPPFLPQQGFACLKVITQHPRLEEEEKFLWLWLFATQSANNPSFLSSFSYEQLSMAVNKPPRVIHRILFRLLIHGCLLADIPIHYGELTLEMTQKVRTLELLVPPLPPKAQEETKALALPRKHCQRITLNLITQKETNSKPPTFIPLSLVQTLYRFKKNAKELLKKYKD